MATASAVSSTSRSLPDWVRGRILLVAATSLIYAAILSANIVLLLLPPRLTIALSTPLAGQAHVAWVLPGSLLWDRGVRMGDRILSVDGHAATQRDGGVRRVGEVVAQTAHGPLRVDAGALRRGREAWPLLVLSPWFLLVGTLIVLRTRRPNVGIAAYTLFASAAFALALAPGADDGDPLATAAELIAVLLFAYAFVRFFLAFPINRNLGGRGWLLSLAPLAAVGLGLAALFLPSLYPPISALRLAVLSIYLAVGAGLLIWGFLQTHDPDVRRGLIVLSAGAVGSVLPLVVLSVAPRLFGWHPVIAPEQSALTLVFLPAGFAYAILRHDVLGVPLFQRWLVRGVLWGGLLLVCAGVALVLRSLPPTQLGAPDLWLTAALLLVGAASFRWLYSWLFSWLDGLIFKDSYDYRVSLQRLSGDLSLAGDLATLAESLPETVRRLMNLRFVALVVYEGTIIRVQGIAGSSDPGLPAALVETVDPSARELHFAAVTDDDHPALFMPLCLHEVVVGCLCLGPKRSGEPFRAVDRDLLTTLSGHLAALVHNARLADDLHLKVRALDALNDRLELAHEEERARLAADLHDEPLQTALYLDRQLHNMNGRHSGDNATSALSHALADQLRAICTGMRPAALDDLGLHAALDMLVVDRRRREGVPIALDADTQLMPGAVSPAIELMLYRAAQEALSNALRHAGSRSIRVSLSVCPDWVQLEVIDDGTGFAVPDRLDRLALDGHLGLAGLHQRVERAGGRLIVISASGQGTTVRVRAPVIQAQL
ncbi:MAG: GAF domain-containing sensor histidine kinase [Chloroflexota bacterium]|nr:GAF domain-containing sensor histidine kinase [Chloroflexota bacterium]